jgi:predicted NAD/FAD-binding protein
LDKTLGEYLEGFGTAFRERYILPMGAAIWSTPSDEMHAFPARTFLQFFKNHGLLGVTTQHQWLTVSGGSVNYVNKIKERISGEIFLGAAIKEVRRYENGAVLEFANGESERYDKVVFATHAPTTLSLLADASEHEKEILGAFGYKANDALLHNDTNALYRDKKIYAAWNYKSGVNANAVTLSYWINRLQNLKTKKEYFVSLNEIDSLENVIERISYEHPQFNVEAIAAQAQRSLINGVNHTYFAGAYWRYGFHEDGLWSAASIAERFGCEL